MFLGGLLDGEKTNDFPHQPSIVIIMILTPDEKGMSMKELTYKKLIDCIYVPVI